MLLGLRFIYCPHTKEGKWLEFYWQKKWSPCRIHVILCGNFWLPDLVVTYSNCLILQDFLRSSSSDRSSRHWHCVTHYWLFFLVCPGPMTSQLRIEQNNKSSFLLFLSRVYNLRPLQVLLFMVNKNSPRSCLIINETFCSIHATYVLIY